MAKYIDAERLKAEIERRKQSLRVGICSDDAFTKEQKKEMLVASEEIDRFNHIIDSLQQEQPDEHYTKRNELFDKCVANCEPKVMKEVSDNVDKLRAISTPAEEDWFKVAEEWEKEDEMALRIIKKRMCYDPVPISDEDRRIVENWLKRKEGKK